MLLTRRIRFDPVRSDLIQYAPVWSGIIRIVPASHNKSLQYSPNKQECTGYIRVSLGAQFQQFQHFCVIWLWKPAPVVSPGWWAPGSWPALAGELQVPGSALAGELQAPGQPWLVSSGFLVQPWLVSSRLLVSPGWLAPGFWFSPGWWALGSWSALAGELQAPGQPWLVSSRYWKGTWMVWFFFSTTRCPRRVEAPMTTTLSPFSSRASPGGSSENRR